MTGAKTIFDRWKTGGYRMVCDGCGEIFRGAGKHNLCRVCDYLDFLDYVDAVAPQGSSFDRDHEVETHLTAEHQKLNMRN